MPLTAAEKMRKYRERLKEDPVTREEYLTKERDSDESIVEKLVKRRSFLNCQTEINVIREKCDEKHKNAFVYAGNSNKKPELKLHQFPTQPFPLLQRTQQLL